VRDVRRSTAILRRQYTPARHSAPRETNHRP
jgi:hypothetical protein